MNKVKDIFWIINLMKETCPTECHVQVSEGPRVTGLLRLSWHFGEDEALVCSRYLDESQLENIHIELKECRRKMCTMMENARNKKNS